MISDVKFKHAESLYSLNDVITDSRTHTRRPALTFNLDHTIKHLSNRLSLY